MELKQYLSIIQRRKWIIILTTILVTLAVAILTFLATPKYVSWTTLRVATITNIDYTQVLMKTYARMVTSGTTKSEVRELVGSTGVPEIEVELIPGTELMTISAEATDPETAQAIASTAADLLVAQSREVYGGSGQTTAEILFAQVAQAEEELISARLEYEQMLEESPDETVILDAMSQSIALKERTQATLLEQYEDARIQETLLANSVSVVEPAYLPVRPAKPRVALNLVLGVAVGLIAGLALALLVDNLDTRLHTSEEIEELTQVPTIGKIPTARDDLHIARLNNGHYPQLEAFRRLRTNILTMGKQEGPQVVLLTSAQRGEGKSTVSSNLAVTIAQSGRRVILVDCDMRLPTVHKIFDLPNKRGLTSVLTEEVELEDAILYSTFPRLHILTSGPLPPNPTELLGSPQLITLIERMKEEFDFILLDTPALLSVADAAVLAPITDTIIWVISRAQTRRDDIETVRRQLTNVRAKSVEVVINRSSDSSDYTAYGPESFTVEYRERIMSLPQAWLQSEGSKMEIGMKGVEPYVATENLPVVEQKRFYETVKRIQDFTMALMALVLLSPMWLLFALVIKLTSPGPVIYKQKEALGRYGRRITMYKFRTMYTHMDNAHHKEAIAKFVQGEHLDTIQKNGKKLRVYKITRDPRVTPVGRILRKSGLDEIPQLVNVLRGELSIVGPRPPLVYEYEHYTKEHSRRLEVLPGITGLYQVTARSQVPFEKMVEIDMDYINRRSFWLDLKIILMTPWVLITGMGAY